MAGTHTEVLEQLVLLSPDDCFTAFINKVWIDGGGMGPIAPTIVQTGDPETFEGHIRQVPGCIQEEILASTPGHSLTYHVKSGPFPVSYHRGHVEFQKVPADVARAAGCAEAAVTRVVWTCNYTPWCGCACVVGCTIRISFGVML